MKFSTKRWAFYKNRTTIKSKRDMDEMRKDLLLSWIYMNAKSDIPIEFL